MSDLKMSGFNLFGGIPDPTSAIFDEFCTFCEMHSTEVNAALPWLAAELGHNDGYATMLQFVRIWSGTRFYVAKSHEQFASKAGYPLSGLTHGRFLLEARDNPQLEVPSAWGVFLALRRAAIRIALRSGSSAREVSRQFGVTMRSLR